MSPFDLLRRTLQLEVLQEGNIQPLASFFLQPIVAPENP